MLYSKDKLKDLSKYKIRKIANTILRFCVEKLGRKRNRSIPTLIISYRTDTDDWAEYNPVDNIITIYINNIKRVGQLSSTIIHEYTHYKQNILSQYAKLYKKFGYDDHPMEIEAYDAEKKYNRKALNFLRNEFIKTA